MRTGVVRRHTRGRCGAVPLELCLLGDRALPVQAVRLGELVGGGLRVGVGIDGRRAAAAAPGSLRAAAAGPAGPAQLVLADEAPAGARGDHAGDADGNRGHAPLRDWRCYGGRGWRVGSEDMGSVVAIPLVIELEVHLRLLVVASRNRGLRGLAGSPAPRADDADAAARPQELSGKCL